MSLKYSEMVLIDVDGTMVDSVPDLAFCVDETMQRLGLPPRGEQAVRQWVGNGVERLVERALTNKVDASHRPEGFDRAMDQQRARSRTVAAFDHLSDAYKNLSAQGVKPEFVGYDSLNGESIC